MQTIRRTISRADGPVFRTRKGPYQTDSRECGIPIVVTLHPTFLELRQHGKRTSLTLTFEAAYYYAAQAAARDLRKRREIERRQRRELRKQVRR